jgi:hypothetical protein
VAKLIILVWFIWLIPGLYDALTPANTRSRRRPCARVAVFYTLEAGRGAEASRATATRLTILTVSTSMRCSTTTRRMTVDRTHVSAIIDKPDYLAYRFNFETETIEFLPVSRAGMRRAHSLSRQALGPNQRLASVPLTELKPLLADPLRSPDVDPPRFIFHTAFCSSTFLSRCLDVDGVCFGLREPQLLLDAANAKRLQWRSQTTGLGYQDLARLALILLRKHAAPEEKLVIKPINSVNNIITELLQMTGDSKALMLYTDARNFLLSTLKKGEPAKHTVRSMFDLIRCDFPQLAQLRLTDTIHMTDLKVIMTLWRLQVEQARQALQPFAAGNRMASIYGERLIEDPLKTVRAANRFLDLGIPDTYIDGLANGDRLAVDAKVEGQRFSAERREQAYQKVQDYYGDELDNGLRWMVQNNPGTQFVPDFPAPLA